MAAPTPDSDDALLDDISRLPADERIDALLDAVNETSKS